MLFYYFISGSVFSYQKFETNLYVGLYFFFFTEEGKNKLGNTESRILLLKFDKRESRECYLFLSERKKRKM